MKQYYWPELGTFTKIAALICFIILFILLVLEFNKDINADKKSLLEIKKQRINRERTVYSHYRGLNYFKPDDRYFEDHINLLKDIRNQLKKLNDRKK